AAQLGRAADAPSAGIYRAALYLCRPRPRTERPGHLHLLSGPHPRSTGLGRSRRALAGLVPLFPVGGLAGRPAAGAAAGHPAAAPWLGRWHRRERAEARAAAAHRGDLRRERPRLERGSGAAAL